MVAAAAAEGDRHRRRHHGRECPNPTHHLYRGNLWWCAGLSSLERWLQAARHAWLAWQARSTTPLYSILCCYGTARRRHQLSRGVILGHKKNNTWNLDEIFCRHVDIYKRDFLEKIQKFSSTGSILFYFLKSRNWKNRKKILVQAFSNPQVPGPSKHHILTIGCGLCGQIINKNGTWHCLKIFDVFRHACCAFWHVKDMSEWAIASLAVDRKRG